MKINKQLFEDILSGKLKGIFVLRNRIDIETNDLIRNISNSHYVFPYKIYDRTYTENGLMLKSMLSEWDIIDFLPYTDMKENELTIEIPNGKIVDWDESKKQNKIVLKDKQLTYEDICKKLFQPNGCYYICENGEITNSLFCIECFLSDANNAISKHQLECIIAKNKLANVAVYLNNGWKPTDTDDNFGYFIFKNELNKGFCITLCDNYMYNNNVLFKTQTLAKKAIEILGEETIKFALEPLGI